MKIKTVEVSRLYSFGNFENVKFGYTADVEKDETPYDVARALLARCKEDYDLLITQRNAAYDIESSINDLKMRLAEKKNELERMHEKWEKARAFLDQHGVDTSQIDMPF